MSLGGGIFAFAGIGMKETTAFGEKSEDSDSIAPSAVSTAPSKSEQPIPILYDHHDCYK